MYCRDTTSRMNILFSATHFGFLRNFQSTIRLLAERGHQLHLLAERTDVIDGRKMANVLAGDHPSITFEILPSSRHRLWYALATGVRASLDNWRYLDPRWDFFRDDERFNDLIRPEGAPVNRP